MPEPFTIMGEFIEFAKKTTSQYDLQKGFQSFVEQFGYTMHTCCSFVDFMNPPENSILWLDHIDHDWAGYYVENKFERHDPVILRSTKGLDPYFWQRDFNFSKFTKTQKRIFEEARGAEIVNGLTVPLFAQKMPPTTVNIIGGDDVDSTTDTLNALHLMAVYFHSAALRITSSNFDLDGIQLTGRERECLQWVFAGKSSSVIAQLLNLKPETVNYHLGKAVDKYGVATRHQAAIHAFLRGDISP